MDQLDNMIAWEQGELDEEHELAGEVIRDEWRFRL